MDKIEKAPRRPIFYPPKKRSRLWPKSASESDSGNVESKYSRETIGQTRTAQAAPGFLLSQAPHRRRCERTRRQASNRADQAASRGRSRQMVRRAPSRFTTS